MNGKVDLEGGLQGCMDGGVREWKGGSMESWNFDGYTVGLAWLLLYIQTPPTFKVYSSIPIEIHISDNFLYVSMSHLMAQEFPHGLSQLTGAYLSVTIGVKLERAGSREG